MALSAQISMKMTPTMRSVMTAVMLIFKMAVTAVGSLNVVMG
jgi:hypothetical protein